VRTLAEIADWFKRRGAIMEVVGLDREALAQVAETRAFVIDDALKEYMRDE
jgi:hypothetical protein